VAAAVEITAETAPKVDFTDETQQNEGLLLSPSNKLLASRLTADRAPKLTTLMRLQQNEGSLLSPSNKLLASGLAAEKQNGRVVSLFAVFVCCEEAYCPALFARSGCPSRT
jgi:hypothetical protein